MSDHGTRPVDIVRRIKPEPHHANPQSRERSTPHRSPHLSRASLRNSTVSVIKPGEAFETAIWMDGRETKQQFQACVNDMCEAFSRMAEQNGVVIAQPTFTIKAPGDDRVPPVPDDIQGPRVTLLVGEAMIVAYARQASPAGGFVQQLDVIDRERLRIITRHAHQRQSPGAPRLTDAECDAIAEEIGPKSAVKAIQAMVDSGTVH